jgi:hypothetical protein
MALEGVDIAWARPTIAAIKATGAHWVARYFSPDASKNLTAAEVHDYPAAGLSIVTVFESTAGRATQGRAAGIADAKLAEQERHAVGLPDNHVHHFAVDLDTSWASVKAYFDGVVSVLGLGRTGCYGGVHVIDGAHSYGLNYLWQTVAWSGGVWSPHATIRQTGGTTLSGGADIDYAEVPDFGQYPRPSAPPAPKPKPPVPVPVPVPLEDEMIIVAVDKAAYPDPKTWPGDFLLGSDGTLHHIVHTTDLASFQAAGIKGPVTISADQYNSLVAGK